MKGSVINIKILLRAAGLLSLLALVFTSCGGGGGGGGYGYGGTGTPAPAASSTVQLVACPDSGTTDVSIVGMVAGFSPSSVTVPLNGTVKWNNTDSIQHTVTSTTAPSNGSFNQTVNAGSSVCLKLTSGGTYYYHCSIHPYMPGGTVIVQ